MLVSITELSTLTNKTRPTIYKYLTLYNNGELDEIPFSFIKLFEMMDKPSTSKKDIVKYCEDTFVSTSDNETLNEIISILKENKDKIDLKLLKDALLEELNNGK